MPSVIIVSNRLPVTVKKTDKGLEFSTSIGGVAKGLASFVNRPQNKWIGWPGIVDDELTEDDKRVIIARLKQENCYPVFLTQEQFEGYYNSFSNSVLWPAMHSLETVIKPTEHLWNTYRNINQLFADTILTLSQPKSTIWIHDYHLMLLPAMLRAERPYDSIGFFLHTPFPDVRTFQKLPHAKRLMHGLLGSDLVGLHTQDYVYNFLTTASNLGPGLPSDDQLILPDRTIRVTDFPIGIDYEKYAAASKIKEVRKEVRRLRRKYGRYKIILAFDRLDLTKGFVERLKAFRQFLQLYPEQRGKVIMIMIAAPSRTEIPAYQRLKRQVEKLVDEINDTFGTKRWKPVEYVFQAFPFEIVTALYQVADVAFTTPIKDGMNLMAKEYVAANRNKKGVLILSQTAGAAQELSNALIVDPRKPRTLVKALADAVTMRPRELKERLEKMQDHLSTHTIHHWANSFMRSLKDSSGMPVRTQHLKHTAEDEVLKAYATAWQRLLLLDYDGVLIELAEKHYLAKPPAATVSVLRKLSEDPANHVVVISGRSRDDLEKWLGDLPITLAAEHGTVIKSGKTWRRTVESPRSWKKAVRPILEKYVAETPGALLEEKDTSLVWHYRLASPYHAHKNMVILKKALKPLLNQHGLKAYSGNKILEFKSAKINKGMFLPSWIKKSTDFILAMGDDYTDEDMFRALPPEAYTVKVGPGKTAAGYRLNSVKEALTLLRRLTR